MKRLRFLPQPVYKTASFCSYLASGTGINSITSPVLHLFPTCHYRVNQAYQNVRHLYKRNITGWHSVCYFRTSQRITYIFIVVCIHSWEIVSDFKFVSHICQKILLMFGNVERYLSFHTSSDKIAVQKLGSVPPIQSQSLPLDKSLTVPRTLRLMIYSQTMTPWRYTKTDSRINLGTLPGCQG